MSDVKFIICIYTSHLIIIVILTGIVQIAKFLSHRSIGFIINMPFVGVWMIVVCRVKCDERKMTSWNPTFILSIHSIITIESLIP